MPRGNPASLSSVPAPRPAAPARGLQLKHISLVLWLIYLVLSPFYVFASGSPQPADAVMGVLVLLFLTGYFVRVSVHRTLYLCASLFLGLVAIINWIWWVYYPDPKFLLSSIFYLYNFSVVMVVVTLAKNFEGDIVSWTRTGLLVALALELAVIILLPHFRGVRAIGTFNNPNQLGYWCLLMLACLLVLKDNAGAAKGETKLTVIDIGVFLGLAFIDAHSLSKAAMISYVALILMGVYYQGMTRLAKLAAILLVIAGASMITVAQVTPSLQSTNLLDRVVARLQDIGKQRDDSFAERGYDRIWEHPELLLYGAGEGAPERFDSPANEMHSTFGTVLFSYGILGLLLFLGLLWLIFRRAEPRHIAYFAPACLYGLTHQGLRFSLLWVFLGLVFSLTAYSQPRIAVHLRERAYWSGHRSVGRAAERDS